MGSRTTFNGYVRQRGTNSRHNSTATPGVSVLTLPFSFDPTQTSASLSITLPAGSKVIDIHTFGGATGGTNPTVDIGTSSSSAAFANEVDADASFTSITASTIGASTGTTLSADTLVYGGVGASAATGGTVTGNILYVMVDDGAEGSGNV